MHDLLTLADVSTLFLDIGIHELVQLAVIPLLLLEGGSHRFEARAELFQVGPDHSQLLLGLLVVAFTIPGASVSGAWRYPGNRS